MGEAVLFDTLRQGLWVAVIMTAPILTVALAAGILVGLFQALTSVQEMTLTFVPKIGAMLVAFWMTMGFMTDALTDYFKSTLIPLIAGM
ncbi:MAG: flagellar biosynthetic protein FliQ [Paracoccaceae bacterium]|nr:flagellar biosynthetic protein FliQ [Paracoccaceae bacterium]